MASTHRGLKMHRYGRCVRSARQQSGVRTSACEWQRKCRSAGTSSLLPTLERTGHGYIYMTHYWTLCTRCSPLRARRGTPTEGLQSQISRLNAPIHGVAKQWQGGLLVTSLALAQNLPPKGCTTKPSNSVDACNRDVACIAIVGASGTREAEDAGDCD